MLELEKPNSMFSVQWFIGIAGYSPDDSGLLTADSWIELRQQIADLFTEYFNSCGEESEGESEARWLRFDKAKAKIALASKPEEIPYLGHFEVVGFFDVSGITFDNWVFPPAEPETTPPPTEPEPTPALELGDMRQVGLFSWEYCLVTDEAIIEMIFEDLVIKDSSNTPCACLFVLSKDGAWAEVWGSSYIAPQKLSYAELLWIGETPAERETPETQIVEQEPESEEENHFSYEEGKTNEKNDKAETALDNFMDAVNAGDEEKLAEIADEAFECFVYETVPTDDESKSPSKLIFIEEEKFDAPIDSDENDWHIASVKSYVFGEKRED